MSGPQDQSKMPIVILNVPISIVYEFVLTKSEDGHQAIKKVFRFGKIRNGYIDVVDSDDLDVHSSLRRGLHLHHRSATAMVNSVLPNETRTAEESSAHSTRASLRKRETGSPVGGSISIRRMVLPSDLRSKIEKRYRSRRRPQR